MGQQTSRLHVDVRAALKPRVARLLDLGELGSQRELLDTSVTVLEWAVNQRLNGRIVGSIDESTGIFRELHMPYLEACGAKAPAQSSVTRSRRRDGASIRVVNYNAPHESTHS
jgi:hypothetical protein